MGDQESAKISVKSTRDVQFTSVQKKQALKSERKYKNHRLAEYHILKGRKTLFSAVHGT